MKEIYIRVIGSLNNLEAQFAEECEAILTSRENEDTKLDEKKKTLYGVLGKKLCKNMNEMHSDAVTVDTYYGSILMEQDNSIPML